MANTDFSPDWHDVADRGQLEPDFPLSVEVRGQQLGLYVEGNEVFALEDVCPHAFALLSEGLQENGVIECPLHAARFEVATGRCLNDIGQRDIQCFPVRVVGERVLVKLADRTPAA
jgi:nitrite reductase/ring-hydroxylating ferredoxin subunit